MNTKKSFVNHWHWMVVLLILTLSMLFTACAAPTPTPTPVPTATSVPEPTATPVSEATPTNTPVPQPTPTPVPPTATPTPVHPLTLEMLQNATYPSEWEKSGAVTLTDGRYEGEPFVEGGASRLIVTLVKPVAFGDLDDDGVEDAAVMLAANAGGSGTFISLEAVRNEGGEPVQVATYPLGDRARIESLAIESGQIMLEMITHGPDDPMCCPTQEVTKRYRLQGDQLVELFQFAYDFESDVEGWLVGFADLPGDYEEDIFELDSGHLELPIGSDVGGIYIQGHNRSDDLFMFLKKQVDGLKPETTYQVTFMLDLATNVPAGLMGIGGSPGESVFVKAGASAIEPLAEEDASGYLRMNIDKGNQGSEGQDMINLGDVAHPELGESAGEEYKIKTLSSDGRSFEVVTDADGGLWFIVGTDSGFEGLTALYYSQISIALVEAS